MICRLHPKKPHLLNSRDENENVEKLLAISALQNQAKLNGMQFTSKRLVAGIWNGTMEWKMEWNSECTQLQLIHIAFATSKQHLCDCRELNFNRKRQLQHCQKYLLNLNEPRRLEASDA